MPGNTWKERYQVSDSGLRRGSVLDFFLKEAKKETKRIILLDGEDERVIKASYLAVREKIAEPILFGKKVVINEKAKQIGVDLAGIEIVEQFPPEKLLHYSKLYSEIRGISSHLAEKIIKKPIIFGALMVRADDADGIVGGATYTSAEFIAAMQLVIGIREGVSVPSSFFIMDIPGFKGGENGKLIYADAAFNPDPNPEELADIAIMTALSAKMLLNWHPRVAMLSFSTKGSAVHPKVDKVIRATEIAKSKAPPGVDIDGELQADAAIVPEVAKKKIKEESAVAGKANILIFPDLDSANIAYKLTQWTANAGAYGPILQGFNKPASDLSRGATVEDILGVIAICAVKAQKNIG
ncbi:MAG: phosphate acyltransferase [Thermoproteota archaeon]